LARRDQGAQDREWQRFVEGFSVIPEPGREIPLLAERTEPNAILVNEPAQLPQRQFELDQRERRFGPRLRFDQTTDPCSLASTAWRVDARARAGDKLRHQIGRND
jgi:hypothetical protein